MENKKKEIVSIINAQKGKNVNILNQGSLIESTTLLAGSVSSVRLPTLALINRYELPWTSGATDGGTKQDSE